MMLSTVLAPLMLLGVAGEYYVQLETDYPGSDLEVFPKNQVPNTYECARKCEEYDDCEIWKYINVDYPVKSVNRGCYLKGNGGQVEINQTGIIVGRRFDKIRHSRICAMDYGVDYNGFNFASQSVNSPDECCGLCQATDACHVFTFSIGAKICWLKTAKALAHRMAVGVHVAVSGKKVSCAKFKELPGKIFAHTFYSGHFTRTRSAKDCMRECMLTIGCNLAGWNAKNQNCRISSVNPDEKPDAVAEKTGSDRVLFQRID